MIHMAVVVALALVTPASVVPAQMSRDVLDALQPQIIEGKDVAPIIAELRKFVPEITRACDRSTKLRIEYRGPDAFVHMLIGDTECYSIRGPANGVRFLIFQVHGQSA